MKRNDEDIISLFFDVNRLNQRLSVGSVWHTDAFRGQYHCLSVLEAGDNISQKEVADLLHIRPASAGELLDKLEAKGWVSRSPSPTDKRVRLVRLTPLGKEQIDTVRKGKARRDRGMLSPLTEEEKEQFYTILKKIKDYYLEIGKKNAEKKEKSGT